MPTALGYLVYLRRVVFDLDAQRLQELKVLFADFEVGIAGEGSDHGSSVARLFAGAAHPNGGFEDEENVVTAIFDPGNNVGNLLGIRQRLVDCFAQFFHQIF